MENRFPELKISQGDRDFSLPACPVPPPALRRGFRDYLDHSSVFFACDDEEAFETFCAFSGASHASDLDIGELAGYISDLFVDAFGENSGLTIMNTLFYQMIHVGDQWIPVRSYALEILKLFHHVLLPDLKTDMEGFISRLSRFVLRKLCTNAICEVRSKPSKEDLERGTYPISSTVFFTDFLELADEGGAEGDY